MKLLLPVLLCAFVAPHFGVANEKWEKWTKALKLKSFQLNIQQGKLTNVPARIETIPSSPPAKVDEWVIRITFKSVERIATDWDSTYYGEARVEGGCDVKYDSHTKTFSLPQEQKNLYVVFRTGKPSALGKTRNGFDGKITIVDMVGQQTDGSADDARKAGEAVVKVLNEQKWAE